MSLAPEDEDPRCADPIDAANQIAELHNRQSLGAVRHLATPEQVPDEAGNYPVTECRECGDELSPARLKTGRTRCVPCVEFEEEEMRRRRGR